MPIHAAALWLNRYAKYWQQQFDLLAAVLTDIEPKRAAPRRRQRKSPPPV
jgi:hypothetical protein